MQAVTECGNELLTVIMLRLYHYLNIFLLIAYSVIVGNAASWYATYHRNGVFPNYRSATSVAREAHASVNLADSPIA